MVKTGLNIYKFNKNFRLPSVQEIRSSTIQWYPKQVSYQDSDSDLPRRRSTLPQIEDLSWIK